MQEPVKDFMLVKNSHAIAGFTAPATAKRKLLLR
jgi:hypothetical protein